MDWRMGGWTFIAGLEDGGLDGDSADDDDSDDVLEDRRIDVYNRSS